MARPEKKPCKDQFYSIHHIMITIPDKYIINYNVFIALISQYMANYVLMYSLPNFGVPKTHASGRRTDSNVFIALQNT